MQSVEAGELYLGESDGEIVSCMVVNHECNEGYRRIAWMVRAEKKECLVLHALGVKPSRSGRGIAKQMVQKVIALAGEREIKTIRLDVLCGNLPAERVYTGMGFTCLDTISMYYEDTGWTEFKVFEYVVSQS